jgi:hypothetical protein
MSLDAPPSAASPPTRPLTEKDISLLEALSTAPPQQTQVINGNISQDNQRYTDLTRLDDPDIMEIPEYFNPLDTLNPNPLLSRFKSAVTSLNQHSLTRHMPPERRAKLTKYIVEGVAGFKGYNKLVFERVDELAAGRAPCLEQISVMIRWLDAFFQEEATNNRLFPVQTSIIRELQSLFEVIGYEKLPINSNTGHSRQFTVTVPPPCIPENTRSKTRERSPLEEGEVFLCTPIDVETSQHLQRKVVSTDCSHSFRPRRSDEPLRRTLSLWGSPSLYPLSQGEWPWPEPNLFLQSHLIAQIRFLRRLTTLQ